MTEIWHIIILSALGLFGVLLLWLDVISRRADRKAELDFRKELLAYEKQTQDERKRLQRENVARLSEASGEIATILAMDMQRDIGWAVNALERAKLGPHAHSIFGERSTHFRDEKEDIAEHFVPRLFGRCRRHIDAGNHVVLLLDSGTTLYPFFDRIAVSAIRCREGNEPWIDHLSLATNNLPGIERLMEVGRVNPNSRYSPLAVKSELFPGTPLPIYAAVTGRKTVEAVGQLRKELPSNSIVIALVVGNWLSINTSGHPHYPVPLGRGEGHLEFKSALIEAADEIYVVAPLGKVFRGPGSINAALRQEDGSSDPDKQKYEEVSISLAKRGRVKLISTSRDRTRILGHHSDVLCGSIDASLSYPPTFETDDVINLPHVMHRFDKLPSERFKEQETEFPHGHTRTDDFMGLY